MPLAIVRSMLRIACRRRPAIPVLMRSPPLPASSIAMQRLRASWRSSAQRRPARTSLSGRSRWMLRNIGEERVSETVRAAKIRARVRGSPLRTRKRKRPRKRLPRAFAFLGDRGDRSPGRRSVRVVDAVVLRQRAVFRPPAGVRIAQVARRCEAAVIAKGGRHRDGSKQGIFDAVVLRWARTLHPSFSLCKHFFHIRPSCRRTVCGHCSSGASARQT